MRGLWRVSFGVVLLLAPVSLEAQNSVYSVRGIGFPQRAYSARAEGDKTISRKPKWSKIEAMIDRFVEESLTAGYAAFVPVGRPDSE